MMGVGTSLRRRGCGGVGANTIPFPFAARSHRGPVAKIIEREEQSRDGCSLFFLHSTSTSRYIGTVDAYHRCETVIENANRC